MENKIKNYRDKVVNKLIADLDELLCATQSPIEELFLYNFLAYSDSLEIKTQCVMDGTNTMIGMFYYALTDWYGIPVKITPQAEIEKYLTVDFKIEVLGKIIIIECDGHDFHERTKEQASRDKARDRKLAKMGFVILRFSGSDIFNKSNFCIKEVEDFIIQFAQEDKNGQ